MIDSFIVWSFSQPPGSTLLITTMALGVNILFSAGRRFLTDVEKTKRIQAEVKEFQTAWKEAISSKDKQKQDKLSKIRILKPSYLHQFVGEFKLLVQQKSS